MGIQQLRLVTPERILELHAELGSRSAILEHFDCNIRDVRARKILNEVLGSGNANRNCVTAEGTKKCNACLQVKPIGEFHTTGFYQKQKLYKPDCKHCANQKWAERHQEMLESLNIDWRCTRCGYNKCKDALDFHHLDSADKDFNISNRVTISRESLVQEIAKCILLCAVCHREHHAGLWIP